MHILLCCTNQKNMLQKEKIEPLKSIYFDCNWLKYWKWLVPDPMPSSWIFCQREFGLFFLQHNNLLKVRKTTDLTKVRKNERVGSILTCPKSKSNYQFSSAGSQENDQFENLYISSHGKTRNIKFGSASGGSDIITS